MNRTRRPRLAAVVLLAAAAVAATACGRHDATAPLTITTYQGVDWLTDGTVKPPADTSNRDGRIRYPHSMNGAVMAAVDSQTLLDTAPDTGFGDVARDYFAASPGLTSWLASRAQLSVTGIDPNRVPHLKGFRFTGYDDKTATVEIFLAQPDRSITGLSRRLVWIGETWLIQIPKPGDANPIKAYDALPGDINTLPQT